AEQELFLVDKGWRPAPVATELLDGLDGDEFTTELARFNLEINLPPMDLNPTCFRTLEDSLESLVGKVRSEALRHRADVVLTGILPTLQKSDLALENLTPRPRYYALNDAMTRRAAGSYRLHIQGTDELHVEHDSILLEGCNTSFQLQRFYNVALAMAGPVLAACANSPILFGKRLWAETRIALFQQALDIRRTTPHVRELTPRVRFGESWVKNSVLEIFQEDVARVPSLLGTEVEQDPFAALQRGEVPELQALQLYNGTVYRWIRPCYGILNAKPHLRIECRFLPSGPSIPDEVANAALWIGVLLGGVEEYDDITRLLEFDDARANLLAAARRRVSCGSTGARWLTQSLTEMGAHGTRAERMAALTAAIAHRQQRELPVHDWELAMLGEGGGWRYHYRRVEQYMTTDLFTVKEDEIVDLAALLMDWKRIRQVLVEDDERRLAGWVTYGSLLRLYTSGQASKGPAAVSIREIMERVPVEIAPETETLEAIALMRKHQVRSLPVTKGGKLVGIVSVEDFIPIAERLLEEKLEDE
ncbi:MAG: glutamate-cysteine ligase family protein, partial [Gemmatimonadales bacterium]